MPDIDAGENSKYGGRKPRYMILDVDTGKKYYAGGVDSAHDIVRRVCPKVTKYSIRMALSRGDPVANGRFEVHRIDGSTSKSKVATQPIPQSKVRKLRIKRKALKGTKSVEVRKPVGSALTVGAPESVAVHQKPAEQVIVPQDTPSLREGKAVQAQESLPGGMGDLKMTEGLVAKATSDPAKANLLAGQIRIFQAAVDSIPAVPEVLRRFIDEKDMADIDVEMQLIKDAKQALIDRPLSEGNDPDRILQGLINDTRKVKALASKVTQIIGDAQKEKEKSDAAREEQADRMIDEISTINKKAEDAKLARLERSVNRAGTASKETAGIVDGMLDKATTEKAKIEAELSVRSKMLSGEDLGLLKSRLENVKAFIDTQRNNLKRVAQVNQGNTESKASDAIKQNLDTAMQGLDAAGLDAMLHDSEAILEEMKKRRRMAGSQMIADKSGKALQDAADRITTARNKQLITPDLLEQGQVALTPLDLAEENRAIAEEVKTAYEEGEEKARLKKERQEKYEKGLENMADFLKQFEDDPMDEEWEEYEKRLQFLREQHSGQQEQLLGAPLKPVSMPGERPELVQEMYERKEKEAADLKEQIEEEERRNVVLQNLDRMLAKKEEELDEAQINYDRVLDGVRKGDLPEEDLVVVGERVKMLGQEVEETKEERQKATSPVPVRRSTRRRKPTQIYSPSWGRGKGTEKISDAGMAAALKAKLKGIIAGVETAMRPHENIDDIRMRGAETAAVDKPSDSTGTSSSSASTSSSDYGPASDLSDWGSTLNAIIGDTSDPNVTDTAMDFYKNEVQDLGDATEKEMSDALTTLISKYIIQEWDENKANKTTLYKPSSGSAGFIMLDHGAQNYTYDTNNAKAIIDIESALKAKDQFKSTIYTTHGSGMYGQGAPGVSYDELQTLLEDIREGIGAFTKEAETMKDTITKKEESRMNKVDTTEEESLFVQEDDLTTQDDDQTGEGMHGAGLLRSAGKTYPDNSPYIMDSEDLMEEYAALTSSRRGNKRKNAFVMKTHNGKKTRADDLRNFRRPIPTKEPNKVMEGTMKVLPYRNAPSVVSKVPAGDPITQKPYIRTTLASDAPKTGIAQDVIGNLAQTQVSNQASVRQGLQDRRQRASVREAAPGVFVDAETGVQLTPFQVFQRTGFQGAIQQGAGSMPPVPIDTHEKAPSMTYGTGIRGHGYNPMRSAHRAYMSPMEEKDILMGRSLRKAAQTMRGTDYRRSCYGLGTRGQQHGASSNTYDRFQRYRGMDSHDVARMLNGEGWGVRLEKNGKQYSEDYVPSRVRIRMDGMGKVVDCHVG